MEYKGESLPKVPHGGFWNDCTINPPPWHIPYIQYFDFQSLLGQTQKIIFTDTFPSDINGAVIQQFQAVQGSPRTDDRIALLRNGQPYDQQFSSMVLYLLMSSFGSPLPLSLVFQPGDIFSVRLTTPSAAGDTNGLLVFKGWLF